MQNDMRDRFIEDCENLMCFCQSINCYKCEHKDIPYPRCMGVHLADHLIENGVVLPPCRVGQTVYVLFPDPRYNWGNKEITMFESKVYGFHYCDGNDGTIELRDSKNHIKWGIDSFGISIFLTKDQAEQKLKELSDNG